MISLLSLHECPCGELLMDVQFDVLLPANPAAAGVRLRCPACRRESMGIAAIGDNAMLVDFKDMLTPGARRRTEDMLGVDRGLEEFASMIADRRPPVKVGEDGEIPRGSCIMLNAVVAERLGDSGMAVMDILMTGYVGPEMCRRGHDSIVLRSRCDAGTGEVLDTSTFPPRRGDYERGPGPADIIDDGFAREYVALHPIVGSDQERKEWQAAIDRRLVEKKRAIRSLCSWEKESCWYTTGNMFAGDMIRLNLVATRDGYERFLDTAALEPDTEDMARVATYFAEHIGVLHRRMGYDRAGIDNKSAWERYEELSYEAARELRMSPYTSMRVARESYELGVVPRCGRPIADCPAFQRGEAYARNNPRCKWFEFESFAFEVPEHDE